MPRNPDNVVEKDMAQINAKMAFPVKVKLVAKKIKEATIQITADIKTSGEYLLKLQQVGLK